ncbi:PP-loop family protein [Moelleriella libera RCEF 2490]|uniref:tRNA(Ile)-lysidine synthetase n=1 Tax=Moelleriella libera RCEF 2490 TaxID=1081109 RepID=A0A166P7Z8_9HYPO|nr:PP-loop family protein [Moelleriella libera RCEF 2490]
MAMAYLFSNLLKTHRSVQIADNPAQSAIAIVVDHKLRDFSSQEASLVAHELKRMGLRTLVKPLNWKDYLRSGEDPGSLPNVESISRILRYRILGKTCQFLSSSSLFFAHHCDDQYETILMRFMNGHTYRGFQGIREANDIPECYDLHGVYKSGLLDDQTQKQPYLSFKPPRREMRRLRWTMKDDSELDTWEELRSYLDVNDMSEYFPSHTSRDVDVQAPYLTPLDCEDGGVTVYRPLLQFNKDRLIATCEANKIQWFEDHTNDDPSFTPRNAIRQMVRNQLPPNLRKEAVLGMSRDAKRRTVLEENEARRWLIRGSVIRDFDPNAGTLLIRLPAPDSRQAQQRRRPFAKARRKARKSHDRIIAAIAMRKLIEFVTPEIHPPPVSGLETVIDKLFPWLANEAATAEPKAFTFAGVLFEPLIDLQIPKWFLSRAPYASTKPLPICNLAGPMDHRFSPSVNCLGDHQPSRRNHWRSWKTARLWDGRFWIRVSACVSARFLLMPLLPQHMKPFRKALPPRQRAQLERVLRYYAPGKVRYSLPALYSVEAASAGGKNPILTLLALPSLGVHVPGLERWLKYEVRYRWVDLPLLSLRNRGGQGAMIRKVVRSNPGRGGSQRPIRSSA